jgi:GAF domain-containing protein
MHVVHQAGAAHLSHANIALDRVPVAGAPRVERRADYRPGQLTTLRDITFAITSTLEFRTVLDTLLEKILTLLPYNAAAIRLLDEHGTLQPVSCKNLDLAEWKAGYRMGFADEILRQKIPVASLDVQNDPKSGRPAFFRKHGLVSFLGLPLILKHEVIGILAVYTKTRYVFRKDEIEFLSTLAGQAAIAIHNSKLYEESKRQEAENGRLLSAYRKQASDLKVANEHLASLFTVTAIAARSLDLDLVAKQVIKKMTQIFGFHYTRIFLHDPQTNKGYLRASFETYPNAGSVKTAYELRTGIPGKVAKTGSPMIFNDIRRDPAYAKLSVSKHALRAGFSFFAAFPIKTKSKIVGCLIFTSKQARQLTRNEIRLIKAMASQIAVAVERNSLFETTKNKVAELLALYQSARLLNQSLQFKSLMRRVMTAILSLFKFQAGGVYLMDEETRTLTVLVDKNYPDLKNHEINGIFKQVIRKNRPLLFEDIQNNVNYQKWSEQKAARKHGFRSAFYLPIRAQGKIIGVISFLCRRSHRFSRNEIQLIDTIASHLGTAVRNAQLYEAVVRSRDELQKLTVKLQTTREKEYARLSTQVHDELGQPLVALKMALSDMLNASSPESQPRPAAKGHPLNLIDGMITTVRNISKGLHPSILDHLDLAGALKWQIGEFQNRTGLRCRLKITRGSLSLDKRFSVCLFRVLQEALANIQRHANATRVDIELKRTSSHLSLKIHDNGKGISKRHLKQKDSLGLLTMRERVLDCGGHFEIFGSSGRGTTLIATVPDTQRSGSSYADLDY